MCGSSGEFRIVSLTDRKVSAHVVSELIDVLSLQFSKRSGLRTCVILLMSVTASVGFALQSSAADDKVDAAAVDTVSADEAAELVLTSPETSAVEASAGANHADTASHDGDSHGSGEHAESPGILSFDLGSAIWNLIIFLLVLAILSKFVWPGILGGLQAREDKIRGDLESAESANAKAQSLLGEYQKKLDEAAVQVQTMLAEARRDAEASGQRIVADAKAEADRQRERAVADIETAKKVAMADLAGSTADLAMNVARSVVGRELRAEDHADLVRQSLDRLPSHN